MSSQWTETDSGLFVRVPAWHGMGKVLDGYPESWEQARQIAGLTWEPVEAPSYAFSGVTAEGAVTYDAKQAAAGEYVEETEKKRIVRSDNGYTLGVPSNYYSVINHAEIGEIIEALLENEPALRYETLFSVYGGRMVAATMMLDEPVKLPGDSSETLPYIALTARHDGSGAVRAMATSVRVVCANTISAAEAQGEANGTAFAFTHSGSWRERIEEARAAVRGSRRAFKVYAEIAEALGEVRVNREQEEKFIRVFIPEPPDGLMSNRVRNNIEAGRDALRTILSGPTCETIRGTGFGLVQASVEYLDHFRKYQNQDTYVNRTLLKPEPLKARAIKLVREIVNA